MNFFAIFVLPIETTLESLDGEKHIFESVVLQPLPPPALNSGPCDGESFSRLLQIIRWGRMKICLSVKLKDEPIDLQICYRPWPDANQKR